jgi:hypothetical protein
MTPQGRVPPETVTIGKCACGHSGAAHNSKFGGCGFCACLLFHLDDIVREERPPQQRRRPLPEPPKS